MDRGPRPRGGDLAAREAREAELAAAAAGDSTVK